MHELRQHQRMLLRFASELASFFFTAFFCAARRFLCVMK
jgi:hypothetical protein